MHELKKIGAKSVGKIFAVIYAVFGFFMGLGITIMTVAFGGAAAAVFSQVPATATSAFNPLAMVGAFAAFGVLAVVIIPIMSAIGGFVAGAFFAVVYNLIAGRIGGIELDLSEASVAQNSAAPPAQQPASQPPAPQPYAPAAPPTR